MTILNKKKKLFGRRFVQASFVLYQYIQEREKVLFSPNKKICHSQKSKVPCLVVSLLDRRINFITIEAIIEVIHQACTTKKKLLIASYNVNSFNLTMQMPWFYQFQESASIARCDGLGIIKALSLLGLKIPKSYRVSGTELIPKLLKSCEERGGGTVFLLGAKPQSLERALTKQKKKYPCLNFTGHHGYFDKEDPLQNQTVIEKINHVKPDLLIVGMGMPVQEKWIGQHYSQLEASVILPCGAVIDRLAGLVPDCPAWVADGGLEWLYRLSLEPKRLAARYLLGNFAFLFTVALAKFQGLSFVTVTESHLGNPELLMVER